MLENTSIERSRECVRDVSGRHGILIVLDRLVAALRADIVDRDADCGFGLFLRVGLFGELLSPVNCGREQWSALWY